MYWLILALVVHFVSGHHGRDSMLYEEDYRGDSDEADAIMYHRDDNAHVHIKSNQDLNQYVNYTHEHEHGFTKHFLPNKTTHGNDHAAKPALRSKPKNSCESGLMSIIEKTAYCQLCICYKGQWLCMYLTSCYYKYDFSNKLCSEPNANEVNVYFQDYCYVCTCEDSTEMLRCVKNPKYYRNEHCAAMEKRDILSG